MIQVAELLFDCKPEAYASLFMMAKSQDILLWFDHFTDNGLGQFQFGSKALAQYALRKREEVCAALYVPVMLIVCYIDPLFTAADVV